MDDEGVTEALRGRRMTLKEVAAALGVSPMTVSNAYNRPDQLSAATRERVLTGAARLGYPGPNPTARSLRRRRVGVVGVLYPAPLSYSFSDPAAVLFLQGVSLATESAQLGLLLLSNASHEDPGIVTGAAVDGIIAGSLPDGDPLLEVVLGRGLPVVLVDQTPVPGVSHVGVDDSGGARAAARHLVELGHRSIGVISLWLSGHAPQVSGPADTRRQAEAVDSVSRARLEGYREVLEAHGLTWDDVPVYECAGNSRSEGAAAAEWLLTQEPRPTGILAMSDQLALGAMELARTMGLSVPEDLSLVGFDDVPAAAWSEPGLTTIRQPLLDEGLQAASILVASVDGSGADVPQEVILPTGLVVRGSTAAPRGQ